MFNSISWQDFLFGLLLLIAGYYVIIALLFYRVELRALFNGESRSKANLNEKAERPVDDALLVRIATPVQQVDEEEFIADEDQVQFQMSSNLSASDRHSSTPLIGDVSDFLNEFKTLCQVIAGNGASLKEAEPMFKTLLARHTHLTETSFLDAINMHLYGICKETCGFEVELKRVNTWWPDLNETTA